MAYATTTHVPGIAARFGAIAANVAERFARRRVYRDTLNELSQLSGRELADLGLHRSQLHQIAYDAAYGQ